MTLMTNTNSHITNTMDTTTGRDVTFIDAEVDVSRQDDDVIKSVSIAVPLLLKELATGIALSDRLQQAHSRIHTCHSSCHPALSSRCIED
jgi:hypothetical protein